MILQVNVQVIYYQKVVCYVPTTRVRLSSTKLSRNENSTLIILGSMPASFFSPLSAILQEFAIRLLTACRLEILKAQRVASNMALF